MGIEKNTRCFVGLLIDLQRIFKGGLYQPSNSEELLGGGFKYFLCSPLFGEAFQFD